MKHDEEMMRLALAQALLAAKADEVPIGAVLLGPCGNIWVQSHNLTITNNDPTAHAEIVALRLAAQFIGNYRLTGATLYSTIEPCLMCMGALVHARIGHVVFGAFDEKWGGCGSIYNLADEARLNHRMTVQGGILAAESRTLMRDFFIKKRTK